MKFNEAWRLLGREQKDLYGPDQDVVVFQGLECEQKSADGRVTHIISTDSVDRAGDVVMQEGWDFDNFFKNPVVQWGHMYNVPPIGISRSLSATKHRLKAITEFAETAFAQELYGLVKSGILRAWSVGFRALEYEFIREKDDRYEEGRITGIRFLRQELMEYSLCSVPMNPDCVNLAVKSLDPSLQEQVMKAGPIPNSYKGLGDRTLDMTKFSQASMALQLALMNERFGRL